MPAQFAYDASAMRTSAKSARSSLSGISETQLGSIDDCGSSLVASTVAFFVEQLQEALRKEEDASEALAKNIELSADGFIAAEDDSQLQIQALLDSLKGLY